MLTEAFKDTLVTWHSAFDQIYSKRGFNHYLIGDGFDSEMVSEARESTAALVYDWNFKESNFNGCICCNGRGCGCCGEGEHHEGEEE